jgi:hypothetical protein
MTAHMLSSVMSAGLIVLGIHFCQPIQLYQKFSIFGQHDLVDGTDANIWADETQCLMLSYGPTEMNT